jgi:hypothetical protein
LKSQSRKQNSFVVDSERSKNTPSELVGPVWMQRRAFTPQKKSATSTERWLGAISCASSHLCNALGVVVVGMRKISRLTMEKKKAKKSILSWPR